jgi:hypothetical protein
VNHKNELPVRQKNRYFHATINLMVLVDEKWKRIKAVDWTEEGFNFFLDQDLKGKNAFFRQGHLQFSGKLIWRRKGVDDVLLTEVGLNTLIFNRLKQFTEDKVMAQRIIRLIRSPGRIEEKKRLLSTVSSMETINSEVKALMEKEKSSLLVHRFGVRTEALEWEKIVKNTLKTTEVVLILDKLEKKLSTFMEEVKTDKGYK